MRICFATEKTQRTAAVIAIVAAMVSFQARAQQSSTGASTVEQPDNYTWLEDIHGDRPMAWVKAEDARTAAVLEKDSHFAPLEAPGIFAEEIMAAAA